MNSLRFKSLGLVLLALVAAQAYGQRMVTPPGQSQVAPSLGQLINPRIQTVPEHAPGHVVVTFQAGMSRAAIDSVLNRYGMSVDEQFSSPYFVIAKISEARLKAGAKPLSEAARLQLEPTVVLAEIDPKIEREYVPNDPLFNQLFGFHNTGQQGGVAGADVGAVAAWSEGTFSNIVVAVTDDAFEITHPDLIDNLWVNTAEIPGNGIDDDGNGFIDDVNGWDFSHNDNNVMPDDPTESHGTHVVGTIAATHNNGIGVSGIGVNNITYMPLKIAYSGATWMSTLANAVDYAWQNGAQVISVSYNIDGFQGFLVNAVGRAKNAGVIYSNSAGNNGQPNPQRQQLRLIHDNVIFVAATTRNDTLAGFSNWGTHIEIGAAGQDIMSTLLDGTYGLASGTSMSTPLVSGVIAMIWSTDLSRGYREVLDLLIDSADSVPALSTFIPGGKRASLSNAVEQGFIDPYDVPVSSIHVTMGTHADGDIASVETIDGNYFVIDSEAQAGRGFFTGYELTAVTDVDLGSVYSLTINVDSRGSEDGLSKFLYLYNFETGQWDLVRSVRLNTGLQNIYSEFRAGLLKYVNQDGEVRVQVVTNSVDRRRGLSGAGFQHSTDRVTVQVMVR